MSDSGVTRAKLGEYELIQRLAVGGMAEIFLARERGLAGLERRVVVKRILPHLAADAEFVELFQSEAKVVAKLHHPGIVQVHKLGKDGDSWFIAMEYVPGVTVRQLQHASHALKRPMPIPVAMGIVMQACEGAHAAHELTDGGKPVGLVHRDLTPQNLMVTDDGHVKLLDFGIAKRTADSEATRDGGVKGKTSYLSPEQCRQEPLDRRSDIFALGIVLWELLAGTSLFKRHSELETLTAIDRGEWRDLREFCPDAPDDLVRALRKALARDREERFATADELRQALAKVARAEGLDAGIDAVRAFALELVGDRRREEREALDRAFAGVELLSEAMGARLSGVSEDSVPGRTRRHGDHKRDVYPWVAGAVLTLALVIAGAYQLLRRPPPAAPASAIQLSGPALSIGFPPTIDAATMAAELEPLRGYLERSLQRPFTFSVAPSYDELGRRLVTGEVAFALLPANLLLKVRAREPRVEPLATDLIDGSPGNNGLILVSETASVNGLEELRGRVICVTDPASTTGYVLPRAALRRAGLDPDRDVTLRLSGNHQQALRDLFEGRCEAAGTYDKAYLVADKAGVPAARMRTLAMTGRAPNDTITAAPDVAEADRSAVRDALLAFQPQRDIGQPLLGNIERISAFVAPDAAAFERLAASIEAAKGP